MDDPASRECQYNSSNCSGRSIYRLLGIRACRGSREADNWAEGGVPRKRSSREAPAAGKRQRMQRQHMHAAAFALHCHADPPTCMRLPTYIHRNIHMIYIAHIQICTEVYAASVCIDAHIGHAGAERERKRDFHPYTAVHAGERRAEHLQQQQQLTTAAST